MNRRGWCALALLLLVAAVATAIVDDSLDNDYDAVTIVAAVVVPPQTFLRCPLSTDDGIVTRDVHDAFHPPRRG
jgi:hypothetical protein